MIKRVALNGLVFAGMFAGVSALAAEPGFYAGAGVGKASIEVDAIDLDADDTAFKVFGGYNINDYFAVEAAYFDAGKPDDRFGIGSIEVALSGLNVSALGRLPVNDLFCVFAKLGFASYDGEVTGRIGNRTVSRQDTTDEDVTYGVGAAFNIGTSFEVRGEYEAFDISGGSFDLLSVSGVYKF